MCLITRVYSIANVIMEQYQEHILWSKVPNLNDHISLTIHVLRTCIYVLLIIQLNMQYGYTCIALSLSTYMYYMYLLTSTRTF